MRFAFAWITSLLIATAVDAQHPQTVRIQNGNSQGSGVLCGGTDSGSHRVILSVAHVTGTTPGTTMVATVNGRRYQAWLIGADRASDAALLVVRGRHLEDVPSARLWLGEINNSQQTRTEGYSGRRFIQTIGRPSHVVNGGRQLEWTAASYPGMSGGPTYLEGHDPPAFLTTTTGSDLSTMSIGPYRTWFHKWIPTVKTNDYTFTCSGSGVIQMRPRHAIEGPIAIPKAPVSKPPICET